MRDLTVSVAAFASLVALTACARSKPEGVSSNQGGSGPKASASGAAAGSASAAAPIAVAKRAQTWLEAVRFERWAAAEPLLAALSEKERKRPAIRFVRTRVAAELGKHADVLKLSKGLADELPLMKAEIAELRAGAQFEVGPYEEAAAYYAAIGTRDANLQAARAFVKGKKLKEARQVVDKVIVALERAQIKRRSKPTPKNELEDHATARRIRSDILDQQGHKKLALADLQWIVKHAPATSAADGVETTLGKVAGSDKPLTTAQRYDRALALARAGKVDAAEAEVEKLRKAKYKTAELDHISGWANYMARHYKTAWPILLRAYKAGSKHGVRDYYYAAKARSRAHDDAEAAKMYGDIAKRFRGSTFGERAAYMQARLYYIMGDWKQAEQSYRRYLARYRKRGESLKDAQYELAVTLLAGGKHKAAKDSLGDLIKAEKEVRARERLRQLEGIALLKLGQKDRAVARFRSVIRERPLSFAALVAAARLRQAGVSEPPVIEPAKAGKAPPPLKVQLPAKVRLLAEVGLDADAEAEMVRQERKFKATYAPRGNEALCLAYSQFAGARQRYRVASAAVRWTALAQAPSAATRWTWESLYPRPYEPVVLDAAKKHQLAPDLVYSVMRQESGFRSKVVSHAKAIGLMQLIEPTAREVAKELSVEYAQESLRRPEYNVEFGAYYLRKLLNIFDNSVPLALAGYNAGPQAVARWIKSGHKLPLDVWAARIPYRETRGYVARVLGNMARYAYLRGGESEVPKLPLELPKGVQVPSAAY